MDQDSFDMEKGDGGTPGPTTTTAGTAGAVAAEPKMLRRRPVPHDDTHAAALQPLLPAQFPYPYSIGDHEDYARTMMLQPAWGTGRGHTVVVPMQIGAGAWGNPVPDATFHQVSFGNCCYMVIGWLVCCPVYVCLIILVLIFVGAMTWDEIFENPLS